MKAKNWFLAAGLTLLVFFMVVVLLTSSLRVSLDLVPVVIQTSFCSGMGFIRRRRLTAF